jgi:hypothetical protein
MCASDPEVCGVLSVEQTLYPHFTKQEEEDEAAEHRETFFDALMH